MISLTASITNVVGLDGVGGAIGNVGFPMLGNAIGDDAIPSVGIGDVTLLFVETVLPDVVLTANGVATHDPLNTFPDHLIYLRSLLSRSFAPAAQALLAFQLQRLSRRLMKMPVARKLSLVMIQLLVLSFD